MLEDEDVAAGVIRVVGRVVGDVRVVEVLAGFGGGGAPGVAGCYDEGYEEAGFEDEGGAAAKDVDGADLRVGVRWWGRTAEGKFRPVLTARPLKLTFSLPLPVQTLARRMTRPRVVPRMPAVTSAYMPLMSTPKVGWYPIAVELYVVVVPLYKA